MLDLNKPMQLVATTEHRVYGKREPETILPQCFFIKGLSKNYWKCNLDGTIEGHDAWRVENIPDPLKTYTVYGVWYETHYNGGVNLMSFVDKTAADRCVVSLKGQNRFIAEQVVSITV